MELSVLRRLNAARRERRAAIVVTELAGGRVRLVLEGETRSDPLAAELEVRFRSGKSGPVPLPEGGDAFLTVHLPSPRLVLVGAVHISQALAPMARLAGFDVTIVDPRTAFATGERFGDFRLLAEWPEDVLGQLALEPHTAFAALTHDPKIDDLPLRMALEAGCFYVGALGSSRTHAKRLQRLRDAGASDLALGRIRAPIGLPIGAQSPAEIAVAILAEIIGALRQGTAASEAAA